MFVHIVETRYVHRLVCAYIQGLFILYVIRNAHQSIHLSYLLLKRLHVCGKLFFMEDGVYRRQHEWRIIQIRTEFVKAMHGTRRALHDIAQRHTFAIQSFFLYLSQMTANKRSEIVANHHYLFDIETHEDPYQPIDKMFSIDFHQWFRLIHSLLG